MKAESNKDKNLQIKQESELLRQSLQEATDTIEFMVNSLMWSAEYRVLAQSKEKLWKLKKVLETIQN
ncbi:hypothetical protein BEP19_07990 [Ammoniphilus oxalaticus]|uniref:Uncharacterized protein n=1 Tax=Ammoniphilus oxalaticus TaxID=66863 RepID=A0A419SK66_9BACL|nr:hypothetical protein [Ammoniphilus oxalaticus]RKD24329.1 hypothetical protein BEP19_07990 [Ammoniphilus oxalaticus]